ncbi:MAG: hypothetical protein Q9221_003542 [Calogaya cf. arnoldii]
MEQEQKGTIDPGESTHNTFWTLVDGVPRRCFKEDANPRLPRLLDLLSPEETFQHSQRFDPMPEKVNEKSKPHNAQLVEDHRKRIYPKLQRLRKGHGKTVPLKERETQHTRPQSKNQ